MHDRREIKRACDEENFAGARGINGHLEREINGERTAAVKTAGALTRAETETADTTRQIHQKT